MSEKQTDLIGDSFLHLEEFGFAMVPALDADALQSVEDELSRALQRKSSAALRSKGRIYGARHLLNQWNDWRILLRNNPLQELLKETIGNDAGLVRMLYFDKPPGLGWSLPWHRDRTIAVAEHITIAEHKEPAAPFRAPTIKAGIPHVEASEELLQQMVTLRFHIDAMTMENGPLTVMPSTHLDPSQNWDDAQHPVRTITCTQGDCFVMRPLLVHGSINAAPDSTQHRRTIHLEFAPSKDLPGGYQWHRFEPVGNG